MMSDLERVIQMFEALGASSAQAKNMGQQLLKRADQLVEQRGCSRLAATEYLLTIFTKGAEERSAVEGPMKDARPFSTEVDSGDRSND